MFHNPRDYTLRMTSNLASSGIANCPALNEPPKSDRPNDRQSLNAYVQDFPKFIVTSNMLRNYSFPTDGAL